MMQTRARETFTAIRTEGGLLPPDLLRRLAEGDRNVGGLRAEDYHLAPGERLNEATNRAWNRLLAVWSRFREQAARLPAGDPATTLTRDRWLLPLFQELGYGRLPAGRALEYDGHSYPVYTTYGPAPIHLVGWGVDLDRRTAGVAGAARTSPHGLVQELLNRAPDRLWGIVSNGRRLRLLRDHARLTRQAYVEFDLETLFDSGSYADFVLLWLLAHQSRLESEKAGECWLEQWAQQASKDGTRALDRLRDGVQVAIEAFGRGFLAHPSNGALRARLREGALSGQDYYRQVLRLVYQVLFVCVAEDRELLLDAAASSLTRERYARWYSTARLRQLAARRLGTRHDDLYEGLRLVLGWLGEGGQAELGLPALGGLFKPAGTADLAGARLGNADVLTAIRALAYTEEGGARRPVDYRNLGAEEIGSVYESLLELHPRLDVDAASFALDTAAGHERKTTGSYYTPSSLIECLLDSALDPVLDRAAAQPDPEAALLALKICDPACGSGHFLIAAAYRLARRLARVRTGDDEPAPEATRDALRLVVGRCLYGVDVNPMAVELCKVALWLEAMVPGKPLAFLDHHIQCGNSLLGATPRLLDEGIPDAAFEPLTGDDKSACRELKKRNAAGRKRTEQQRKGGQIAFWDLLGDLPAALYRAGLVPDDIGGVREQERSYAAWVSSAEYDNARLRADAWCAAFVQRKEWEAPGVVQGLTETVYRDLERSPHTLPSWLRAEIARLRDQYRFLHWHLAFPDVFQPERADAPATNEQAGWRGGFDVVVGNPPWERIKLQEQEFFAQRDPRIAKAANKAARQRLIDALPADQPELWTEFQQAKRTAEGWSHFVRQSGRFPLTAVGDVNVYALFAEQDRNLLAPVGHLGVVLPTGIATDDTTKRFFRDLVECKALVSYFGFKNEEHLFPLPVEHTVTFGLLTVVGSGLQSTNMEFTWFAYNAQHMANPARRVIMSAEDLLAVNPNTGTCPIFRTRADAELTRAIYRYVPVLIDDHTGANPWGIQFLAMLHMSNDSGLFHDAPAPDRVPLYEAKLFHQFNHRFGTYQDRKSDAGGNELPKVSVEQLVDPHYQITPRYWVARREVEAKLAGRWERDWLLAFRDIARSTDERTAIFSVLPRVGAGNKAPLILPSEVGPREVAALLGNLSALAFDFVARQKVAGATLNFFLVKQFPVLPPDAYTADDLAFIVPRVVELTYTAWDVQAFARDCGYDGPPYRWDDERRALLRAELDAWYAALYGLTRDELRYILDPADVYGPEFPGETFRVLKNNEMKRYGEYRTRRLVLEAWDRLGLAPRNRDGRYGVEPPAPSAAPPFRPAEKDGNGAGPQRASAADPPPRIRASAAPVAVAASPPTAAPAVQQAALPGLPPTQDSAESRAQRQPAPGANSSEDELRQVVLELALEALAAGPRTARELARELTPLDGRIDKSLINSVLHREGAAAVRYDQATYTYRLRRSPTSKDRS